MPGRIVLYGATGYTGELTARALVDRGAKPVLAGRSGVKLRRLADALGGDLETATADVADPFSVRSLVEADDVLITTVGPFARYGEAALEAAVEAGATYIDSTGEPAFIRRVFEEWAAPARRFGATLLTAMGYDWVPGNLAGALALTEAGEAATKVRTAYFTTGPFGPSGGTRASAAGALIEPGYAYRGGRIVTERGAKRVREFYAAGKRRQAISAAASEHFTLPASFPRLTDVDAYLGWFGSRSKAMSAGSAAMSGLFKVPGAKAGAGALIGRFVKGSTGGPSAEQRAKSGSYIVGEALDAAGDVLASVDLAGADGYDFTAGMLAWAAITAAETPIEAKGAVGPVEAYGIERLEEGAADAGIARRDRDRTPA
ncbi:MAG TPA: saccharopine dehydrogenase NADP-binding domain-containing protein [Solirubrobacterales bacterium]